jgi:hypothetical protein
MGKGRKKRQAMKATIPGTVKFYDKDDKEVPENVRKIREKLDAGGFQKVSDEEYQEVISGKRRDFIHKQVEFRSLFLTRRLREQELYEMKDCLEKAIPKKDGHKGKPVKYRDIVYPYGVFSAKFDLELHNLTQLLVSEKSALEYLKRQKMTDEQINNMALSGKYLKVHPEDAMKKKEEKIDDNKDKKPVEDPKSENNK